MTAALIRSHDHTVAPRSVARELDGSLRQADLRCWTAPNRPRVTALDGQELTLANASNPELTLERATPSLPPTRYGGRRLAVAGAVHVVLRGDAGDSAWSCIALAAVSLMPAHSAAQRLGRATESRPRSTRSQPTAESCWPRDSMTVRTARS